MNRLCPICNSANKTFLYKQNFNNKVISLMENYDVVTCKDCGFVYANNIPAQEDFDKYYAEMSKYEFNYNEGVVSDGYVNHFKKIVDFLIPYIKDKNVRILDIGCSTGCLLSLFKQKGYVNLLGIDPSSACIKTVKDLYGIEATVNNISNFTSNEKFDLVILSAVLEHLVDFKKAMDKIRPLLKENGLLFIEIPDAARFNEYIFTPFQQFSIEHINYFSKYSATNLLSKFSFEIIEMQNDENRVNQTIDPDIFILSRKSDKNNFKIIRDDICESKLKDYILQCEKIDLEVKKFIREKLMNKDKIIVWGVGTHTQRLIGSGLDIGKILYFVDSNVRYYGKKIMGIEIKSPNDINEDAPILISTYSYQDEIIRQIEQILKLKNEIIKIYD